MATKSNFKTDSTPTEDPAVLENPAPEANTLNQLLAQRYDVENLADVLASDFVERLDNAVIARIKAKLLSRPAPITVPVVSGNFLAGVTYEN